MGLREVPVELLELILGFVREPQTAAVSTEWLACYNRARPGWQAYYCRHAFVDHYGGYRRRCSGCMRVTFDYLRIMRSVDQDIMRPWAVPTGTSFCNVRSVTPQKRVLELRDASATNSEARKRAHVEDAVPPRQS